MGLQQAWTGLALKKTNTGIVPMFAEQLFKEIETKKAAGGIEFEVKLSMLEIYNEVIQVVILVVVHSPLLKKIEIQS